MTDPIAVAVSALLLAPLLKVVEHVVLPAVYRPDFLSVLAVATGWSSDVWTAAPAGFALGILEDLFVGRALGTRAISLALAASASSLVKSLIRPEPVLSRVIGAAVSVTVADLASFAILRARGIAVGGLFFARWILPVSVAWAAALILPVGFLTMRLARTLKRLWPPRGQEGKGVLA